MFTGLRRRPVWGLVFALTAFGVAFCGRALADVELPPGFPFLTFFPAVILTTFFAGLWPGIVTAMLSGLAAWYFFIPPAHSLELNGGSAMAMGLYVFIVGVDIAVIHVMTTALERLDHERRRSAELTARTQVMFSEMQHRVSNNLQLISSLLMIQQSKVADPAALRALDEARARVATLGRLHRSLHDPAIQSVDVGAYLRELCRDILESAGAHHVRWAVDAEPMTLNPDKLVPLALIVAELVSNALEHAFADGRPGTIRVELGCDAANCCALVVRDDGAGLPPDFDVERQDSLGLGIVRSLARQLGGRLVMASDHGTVCRVAFEP
jgi:two-component sensor histidine kinase